MSTQGTVTPAQRATKRVRIDDTPEIVAIQEVEAPSQAATNSVVQAVASRQEAVRILFKKLATEFVTLKTKQRQLDTTRSRLAEDDTIPRSCRFKFELKAPEFVMMSPKFTTIVEATKQDILEYQKKLKERIVECLDLEIQMTKEKICECFLCTIYQLATLTRIEQNPNSDPTNNDVLKICAFAVKSKLSNSIFQYISSDPLRVLFTSHFVKQIRTANGEPVMTGEMTEQQIHDIWNPTEREATIYASTCDALNKDLRTIFVQSWNAYKDRISTSEKDRALAKKVKEFTTTQATEATAMVIDAEPTVEPKRMNEIVNTLVEKNLKELKKEISLLKQTVSNASKNTKGGATTNSASVKKKSNATKKKGTKTNQQKNGVTRENNAAGSQKGNNKKNNNNNKKSGKMNSTSKQRRRGTNSTS